MKCSVYTSEKLANASMKVTTSSASDSSYCTENASMSVVGSSDVRHSRRQACSTRTPFWPILKLKKSARKSFLSSNWVDFSPRKSSWIQSWTSTILTWENCVLNSILGPRKRFPRSTLASLQMSPLLLKKRQIKSQPKKLLLLKVQRLRKIVMLQLKMPRAPKINSLKNLQMKKATVRVKTQKSRHLKRQNHQ